MVWSIIIFSYNEEGSIASVIEKAAAFIAMNGSSSELIVVNDGSTDHTHHICMTLKDDYHFRYIHFDKNKGIGAALKAGYQAAAGQYVCAVPADGQFDIFELQKIPAFDAYTFYSIYREHMYDSPYRQVLTELNKLFNRVFLGIKMRDVNWIKVYRREQLNMVNIQLDSSILESEICAKLLKRGCRLVEIPGLYHARSSGQAKGGSIKTLALAISQTFRLIWTVWRF